MASATVKLLRQASAAWAACRPRVPDVLVVGNVCTDRTHGPAGLEHRLGGASAFAAQAAACMGASVGLVTAAPRLLPRLRPLRANPRIQVAVSACRQESLFEVQWDGTDRRERVLHAAPCLTPRAIPGLFRQAQVAYVAPVLDECGADLVEALPARTVAVAAQGWLRRLDAHGWVVPAITPAFACPPENVAVMVFSEADHPEAEAHARRLARRGVLVVLTCGPRGGTVFSPGGMRWHYDACPAEQRDPTGAGDTFGMVLTLGLCEGLHVMEAADWAARAAAYVVEGPEMGSLPQASLRRVRSRRYA
jgi:sugar/nucleoside kinase (ribokinase family)